MKSNIALIFAFLAMAYSANCQSCAIVDAIMTSGQYNLVQQSANGVCKEWLVGLVSVSKLIIINIQKANISCAGGDKFKFFSADRSQVLYDHCSPTQTQTYFIHENKYVFLQLYTTSIRPLDVTFGFYFSDPVATTTSNSTTTTITTTTTTTTASQATCGVPSIAPIETGIRIVGGIEAVKNSWPWQAFLTDGSFMCGASLINNNWLVTAAHCLERVAATNLKVYLGVHTLNPNEATTQIKPISRAILYPTYIGSSNSWDNDIALLKMKDPVTFNKQISPLCLPKQGQNLATTDRIGMVTGWGRTSGSGSTSNVLRQATIPVVNCPFNAANMICAGQMSGTPRDSCGGDSGGPFVLKQNGAYVLTGIVSWGGADCLGDGVYTKVSNYIDWINTIISTY
jgi:hypothetical protein